MNGRPHGSYLRAALFICQQSDIVRVRRHSARTWERPADLLINTWRLLVSNAAKRPPTIGCESAVIQARPPEMAARTTSTVCRLHDQVTQPIVCSPLSGKAVSQDQPGLGGQKGHSPFGTGSQSVARLCRCARKSHYEGMQETAGSHTRRATLRREVHAAPR